MVRAAGSELPSGDLPAEKDFGFRAFTRWEVREDPLEWKHDIIMLSVMSLQDFVPRACLPLPWQLCWSFISSGSALAALLQFISSALPS